MSKQGFFLKALLKEPSFSTAESTTLVAIETPPLWTQSPEESLLTLKAPDFKQVNRPVSSLSSLEKQRSPASRLKKTQQISSTKQLAEKREQAYQKKHQAFQDAVHQAWESLPISTANHHPQSCLKWKLKSNNAITLQLKEAHFELKGLWYERVTPRQRRWYLQWVPSFIVSEY